MTIPPGSGRDTSKDITIYSPTTGVTTGYMVAPQTQMQDITPASSRRSDGDARYSILQTESFWGQNDWSAGLGVEFPAEATAHYGGDVVTPGNYFEGYIAGDTTLPHQVSCVRQAVVGAPPTNTVVALAASASYVYAGTSTAALFRYDRAAGTWSTVVAAAGLAGAPTRLAIFREQCWIAYGYAGADVQYWNGAALAAPAYAFKADAMGNYQSMLFFGYFHAATSTNRLNRYDPENATSVTDLAIIPRSAERVRALRALGQALYVFAGDSLWSFTSANGNSGVTAGPLDVWPLGYATAYPYGNADNACVHQGALYYSVGQQIRRLVPGGKPATMFPLIGSAAWERWGDVRGLVSANDLLYVMTMPYAAYGTAAAHHSAEVFAWNGTGMHKVGSTGVLKVTSVTGPIACFVHDTKHCWIATDNLAVATQNLTKISTQPAGTTGVNFIATEYASSVLDFGMYDVTKTLSRIGLACTTNLATGFPTVKVYVDGVLSTFVVDPAAVASASTSTTPPLVYYYPPGGAQSVSGKLFQIVITVKAYSGDATRSQVLRAMTAIPNPNLPIRNGFKFSIRLGTDVMDYQGRKLYANAAAVTAALAVVMAYRGPDHLTLYWVDGNMYSVRMNTRQVRSYGYQLETENGLGYEVSFDCQEMS